MNMVELTSSHKHELIDITYKVKAIVQSSKVKEGICQIFVPHATAAITIKRER
ncbi:MAG TPA: YjbQ family protein [Candidatus Nanoarchaeia archaeon]|nr:YjbQ family protein [Candidatus Nanoarchaeia archaeon]